MDNFSPIESLEQFFSKLKPIKCALDRCIHFYYDEDTLAECKNGINPQHGYILFLNNWTEEEIDCQWYERIK